MKVKELKRNSEGTEADQNLPQIPRKFICIDPTQRHLVVDFLTNFDQDIKELVLTHLRLCLHCREQAQSLLKIKSGHYLHGETKLVSYAGDGEPLAQSSEEDKEIDFA
jgi:hypothetical protein